MPETKKRVVVYDWLRLFAILFVVIGHSSYLDVSALFVSFCSAK